MIWLSLQIKLKEERRKYARVTDYEKIKTTKTPKIRNCSGHTKIAYYQGYFVSRVSRMKRGGTETRIWIKWKKSVAGYPDNKQENKSCKSSTQQEKEIGDKTRSRRK